MDKRFKNFLLRLRPKTPSSRNVLKMAGGTAGGQVITVAATPILTRLYGAESFGVLATFVSIMALVNVVSSLRYELAIVVPEDDDEAVALVCLCFVLVAISTGLTALGVVLLSDQLASWLKDPAIKPLLWLLPVGVLCTGLYQALSYWAIRQKQFNLLAKTKLLQSIFGVVINLTAAPLGAIGLLLGQLSSKSAGAIQLFTSSFGRDISIIRNHFSFLESRSLVDTTLSLLKKYSTISFYNSTAGLANSLYPLLYAFILSSLGNLESLGMLYLAKSLVDAPSALISKSVGDVFLSQVARVKEIDLAGVCLKNVKILCIVSSFTLVPYVLALILFGNTIFGEIWDPRIQIYLAFLVPSSILQIALASTGLAFVTSNRNEHGLFAQIGMLVFRMSPLLLWKALSGSVDIIPQLICLGLFMGYSFYGYVLFNSLTKAEGKKVEQ